MLDLRQLRDDADTVRASQRARGEDPDLVDQVLAADERRRGCVQQFDTLRAEQKSLGKLVAQESGDDKAALLERTKQLAAAVKQAEAEQRTADEELRELSYQLSNIVDADVPTGGEDDYVVLEHIGEPR